MSSLIENELSGPCLVYSHKTYIRRNVSLNESTRWNAGGDVCDWTPKKPVRRLASQGGMSNDVLEFDKPSKTSSLTWMRPLKSCLSHRNLASQLLEETTTPSGMNRKVSFSRIEIRVHPITLGDHPAVRSGPALSLDWYVDCENNRNFSCNKSEPLKNCRRVEVPIDDYEKGKKSRQGQKPVRLSKTDREKMLYDAGITFQDIMTAEMQKKYANTSRRKERHYHIMRKVGRLKTQSEIDELMAPSTIDAGLRNEKMERFYVEHERTGLENAVNFHDTLSGSERDLEIPRPSTTIEIIQQTIDICNKEECKDFSGSFFPSNTWGGGTSVEEWEF